MHFDGGMHFESLLNLRHWSKVLVHLPSYSIFTVHMHIYMLVYLRVHFGRGPNIPRVLCAGA